jgi:hypothetical protein
MFFMMVLSNTVSVQGMKRLREFECVDWDYTTSFLDYTTFKKNRPRYAYFLPEEHQNRFTINKIYLLWSKKMNENEDLLKDVTNHILRYSHVLMILSDKQFMRGIKKLDINESEVWYLNKRQRQGLWFILHHHDPGKSITIQQPADFSRKMVENIVSLPLSIKNKIAQKCDNKIKATMGYRLLCESVCIDDEDSQAEFICRGIICLCICSPLILNDLVSESENKWYAAYNILRKIFTYNYNFSLLWETAEQKEERLKLVEIPLLQEMEYMVVEK